MDYDRREVKSYANTNSEDQALIIHSPKASIKKKSSKSEIFSFRICNEFVALNVRDGNFFFLVYTYFSLFLIS